MKQNRKLLWLLFRSTFALSAVTFGGGYVIVPLLKARFVDELGLVEEEEMLDMVALAQSTPGIIVVNTSILIGHKVAGFPGAMASMCGTVLPPLILLSVVSVFYDRVRDLPAVAALLRGMQAGVAGVICDVVIGMGLGIVRKRQVFSIAVMAGAFVAAVVFGVNVAVVIVACGVVGGVAAALRRRRERKGGRA